MSQSPKSGQFNSDLNNNLVNFVKKKVRSQSPKSGQFNSDREIS